MHHGVDHTSRVAQAFNSALWTLRMAYTLSKSDLDIYSQDGVMCLRGIIAPELITVLAPCVRSFIRSPAPLRGVLRTDAAGTRTPSPVE